MLVNEDRELADLRRRNQALTRTCEDLIDALQTSVHLTINQKAVRLQRARAELTRFGTPRRTMQRGWREGGYP